MEVIQISQRQKRAVQVQREVREADQAAQGAAVHEVNPAVHEEVLHKAVQAAYKEIPAKVWVETL